MKMGIELELSSAIQQYQFFAGQLVQSLGFLIAADAVLLGYSINGHASGAILLAALMPLVMLVVRIEFGRQAAVAAYVAIQLEQQLDIDADPLISMQVASRYPRVYRVLLEIISMESQDARIKTIRKSIQRRYVMKDSDTVIFLGATLVQIGLFLVAFLGLGRPII